MRKNGNGERDCQRPVQTFFVVQLRWLVIYP